MQNFLPALHKLMQLYKFYFTSPYFFNMSTNSFLSLKPPKVPTSSPLSLNSTTKGVDMMLYFSISLEAFSSSISIDEMVTLSL